MSFNAPRRAWPWLTALALILCGAQVRAQTTDLADHPLFQSNVPGNLALALSVEYPTAISVANPGDYNDARDYPGYFDPKKCYKYQYEGTNGVNSYFKPVTLATGTYRHNCRGNVYLEWSGNFLNWATMPAIDPFRRALTGGNRWRDTPTETILEKAWSSTQGDETYFPSRGGKTSVSYLVADLTAKCPSAANPTLVPNVDQAVPCPGHLIADYSPTRIQELTRFNWDGFAIRVHKRGNQMLFLNPNRARITTDPITPWDGASYEDRNKVYSAYIRVKVCDPAVGLEDNCVQHGNTYKPEGLMQQYADKIRYSVFSYLNGNGLTRQGAAMRARMGFIGPNRIDELTGNLKNNEAYAEWDASGVMKSNPDSALDPAAGNSGAINYLNKFGQSGSYMQYDNVSELYYAVLRYFENLGNVPEWSNAVTAAERDGFPAPATWPGDPIAYGCQKNFILGIGDANTWYDYNTGGSALSKSGRAMPSAVSGDKRNLSDAWTKKIETLEGLSARGGKWSGGADLVDGTEYIAGLAYGAHVSDLRPDLKDMQTITTYWVDVMEGQLAWDRNPYWLAAKYGGFDVPAGYDYGTALTAGQWNKNGESIAMTKKGNDPAGANANRPRPDNYFLAKDAGAMTSSLKNAFANIANSVAGAHSTVLASSSADSQAAYAASYGTGWTGTVSASKLTLDAKGQPVMAELWNTDGTLAAQFADTGAVKGWDTQRNVVTWNGAQGAPFRYASLTPAQQGALNTPYATGSDAQDYLNYLRGDRANEQGSTQPGSSKAYRQRAKLLGDIVNARLAYSGPPAMPFADHYNPGYAAYAAAQAQRAPLVLAAANDGMLHALNGSAAVNAAGALTDPKAGQEVFAYVPAAVFDGPSAPATDGLAALGNPAYGDKDKHRYFVDATPVVFDLDFNRAGGASAADASPAPDWRTIVVGGLGKGGKSFYAIDLTDPAAMGSETAAAGKVLWEKTFAHMGFSYGAPALVKTRKYGWTLILTSGYNNDDGIGYLFFVNPKTGALLESVATPQPAPGLTQANAYVGDYTDGLADAVYVGDLNGQLWRFDISANANAYPPPALLFTAKNASGVTQPITTAPLTEVHSALKTRYILFGTGKMLDASDIPSTDEQSFYAIADGTETAFDPNRAGLQRANLSAMADPAHPPDMSGQVKGWYIDLGMDDVGAHHLAWRMVINPVSNGGRVTFATEVPSDDPCEPFGRGRVYELDYGTGKTVLDNDAAFVSSEHPIIELRYMRDSSGKTHLIAGDIDGHPDAISDQQLPLAGPPRLMNWREITVTD